MSARKKLYEGDSAKGEWNQSSNITLDCMSSSAITSSHFSFALGLGLDLTATKHSPATSNTTDILAGNAVKAPVIPLAWVADLDADKPAGCDWDYRSIFPLGAVRIADHGQTVSVKLQRATSSKENPKFIGLFIEAATLLVPFGSAADLAKKLVLDQDQVDAANKVQSIFSKATSDGSISLTPDSWNWRKNVGRRFHSYYVRSLGPFSSEKRIFVVEFFSEPTVSLFDAEYSIVEKAVVRKYDFSKNYLTVPLGKPGSLTYTIQTFLASNPVASSAFKLLKNVETPPSIFKEQCSDLKAVLQKGVRTH